VSDCSQRAALAPPLAPVAAALVLEPADAALVFPELPDPLAATVDFPGMLLPFR
jgi:hypothetical protein